MDRQQEHEQLLLAVCRGNTDAYQYLKTISQVFRIWDDLYDQDKVISPQDADRVFQQLTFDLGRNPFYVANRQLLEGFLFLAWNAWQNSNAWRGSPEKIKGVCAWFLRDFCNEIDILVAWLVGGTAHAQEMSLVCREFYLRQLVANGPDGFLGV